MTKKATVFKAGDCVVYPSHGVGKIIAIENQSIGGMQMNLFVINFEKEKMSLKIPTAKAEKIGLRHLLSIKEMEKVIDVLRSKAKTTKGMWSRRASEYDSKINSGNLMLIAEVVRDLYKNSEGTDRSYSERVIYESALNRLVAEYSILYSLELKQAHEQVLEFIREKQYAA